MTLANNRPSSFARVVACPGSRRVTARFADGDDETIYAANGTAAHAVASKCLIAGTSPIEHMDEVVYTSPKLGPMRVRPDDVRAVCIFVSEARRRMARANAYGVELRVDIPDLDMPKGGTADFWSYEDYPGEQGQARYGVLSCLDYKNGSGVEVPLISYADDGAGERVVDPLTLNPQIGAYLWGLLQMVEGKYLPVGSVQVFEGVVVQPNAQSWTGEPKSVRLLRNEFFAWVKSVAFPAVAASRAPDAPLVAGQHCRKTFCPARGTCPAVLRDAMAEVLAAQNAPRPASGAAIFTPYTGER